MAKKKNIRPITYMKQHTSELVKDVSDNDSSVIVTQNGEAKAVVISYDKYERWQETMSMLKLIALREKEIAQGKVKSHKDVKKKMDAILAELSRVEKEAI